jgi:hypothetical protein
MLHKVAIWLVTALLGVVLVAAGAAASEHGGGGGGAVPC